MKPYWISWWEPLALYPTFEWHGPWWVSGEKDAADDSVEFSICAAVMADSEEDAKSKIVAAHDNPVTLDWRFVEVCEPDWQPFSSRFERRDWMKWPWPAPPSAGDEGKEEVVIASWKEPPEEPAKWRDD